MLTANKIHILIYSGITLLIVLIINIYIYFNSTYQSKIHRIDSNYETLNKAITSVTSDSLLLVVGNSYVNTSFNDFTNNENTVKFVVFGMSLTDMVSIIEHLPSQSPIDNILVGLGYNYAIPVNADSSSYNQYFTSNPVSALWTSLPMVRGRSLTSTIIKEDIICLASYVSKVKCKKNTDEQAEEAALLANLKDHQSKMIASTEERLKEYIPFTSSISPNFRFYIQRLKTACDIRGIKLHAYTAPIYKGLRDQLDPNIINEFRSVITTAGIDYIDMNLIYSNWGAEMFLDATHLNKEDARDISTQFLLKHISANRSTY